MAPFTLLLIYYSVFSTNEYAREHLMETILDTLYT